MSAGVREEMVRARDGHPLAVSVVGQGSRWLVLCSAFSVPREFYRHFALHLATRGWTVVLWDYRGCGDSACPDSRRSATLTDWAVLDLPAVFDWAMAQSGTVPQLLGHSLGGHLIAMSPLSVPPASVLMVCTQHCYWPYFGGMQRWMVGAHVHVTMPVLARIFGRLPWSWFSRALDLPGAAALQWARACRRPGYLAGDRELPWQRIARFSAPTVALGVSDDAWATPEAVDAWAEQLPNAQRWRLDAAQLGVRQLGHMGLFRPRAAVAWPVLASALATPASSSSPSRPE